MRTMIIISSIQFVMILVLVMNIQNTHRTVQSLSRQVQSTQTTIERSIRMAQSPTSPRHSDIITPQANDIAITPHELRQIFRDEMKSLGAPQAHHPKASQPSAITAKEAAKRWDSASVSLNQYIAQGRMSRGEIAQFEQNIARLAPADRQRMLGRLSKALNEGRIDAQF